MFGGFTKSERIAAEYTKQFNRRNSPTSDRTKQSSSSTVVKSDIPRKMSLTEYASRDLASRNQLGGNIKQSNPWIAHVLKYQQSNPGMSYKTALESARPSYSRHNN